MSITENSIYGSLRKHLFLLALRRWGRFARNIPSDEERGETDVFAGSIYGTKKQNESVTEDSFF